MPHENTHDPAQSVAMLTGTDGLLASTPIDRFHVPRQLDRVSPGEASTQTTIPPVEAQVASD
jgi:hypothetical protein